MAKGENKGKGNTGDGVGKSVFLFSIDTDASTAAVVRMPFDTENEDGATLVRNSEFVVRAVTDAALSTVDENIRDALQKLVKQHVRAKVRNSEAFTEIEIDLSLSNLVNGKSIDTGPEDEDEDEHEEEVAATGTGY